MLSEGAGAEMRRTLGTAVFAGMLGVTLFGIFLMPVFFYVIQWLTDRRGGRRKVVVIVSENGNGIAPHGPQHAEPVADLPRDAVTLTPAAD
jgi:multidrug efflux pump